MTESLESESTSSVLLRVAIAAVLGSVLGAAGAWLESLTGSFLVVVALLPVIFGLELLVELGGVVLEPHGKKARRVVIGVLVACYIGSWVALRS